MSTPWFEDVALCEATSVSSPETNLLKHFSLLRSEGKKAPLGSDTTEFGDTLWQRTRWLLLPLSLAMGVLAMPLGIAVHEKAPFPLVAILGLAFLTALAVTYSFGGALRDLACGKEVTFGDAAKQALRRFPDVALTTLSAASFVSMGFMMCIIPGLLVLPFVMRAPYEAALGRGPTEAYKRSFWIAYKVTETAAKMANIMVNVGIALFTLTIAATSVTGNMGVGGVWGAVVVGLIGITISVVIAPAILAAFVTQDAALAGAIHPGNLAVDRLPSTSWWNQKRYTSVVGLARSVVTIGCFYFALGVYLDSGSRILAPGASAPAFALSDLEGQTHALEDYTEQPTLVYFWAPWCRPCKSQVPELNALQKERDDVNVVAIALDFKNEAELKTYVEKQGVEYEILVGTEEVSVQYEISAFPSIVMIDTSSQVLWSRTGVASTEELIDVLDSLQKSPAPDLH